MIALRVRRTYPVPLSSPGGDCRVDQNDVDYYRARIVEEEIAAQRASHPMAADSHKRLAEEYASLLVASDAVAALHLVGR